MSVSLDPPSQLSFRKPFSATVKQSLRVNNHNAHPVAFKVKTTAPKLYCVRPNSGRIEPGEYVDVSVLLQPMKEDPPLSLKCKDKFLVQSTIITPERDAPGADMWSSIPGDDATKIHQQKLKVVYLPAEGTLPEEDETEVAPNQSMFTEGESTLNRYETVRQSPANGHAHAHDAQANLPSGAIPVFDTSNDDLDHRVAVPTGFRAGDRTPPRAHTPDHAEFTQAHENAPGDHEAAPVAPSPVKIGVGSVNANPAVTYDHTAEYAAKLAEANSEINRLQSLLARHNDDTALRRRTILSDDGTSVVDGQTDAGLDDGASVIGATTKPEGVPLNVVAMLSVLVFVITYLFF